MLPTAHTGLTDKETRYRMRYLDLIMNPEARNRRRSLLLHLPERSSSLSPHSCRHARRDTPAPVRAEAGRPLSHRRCRSATRSSSARP